MAKRESSNWPDGHATGRTSCGNQDGKKTSVSLIASISTKALDFSRPARGKSAKRRPRTTSAAGEIVDSADHPANDKLLIFYRGIAMLGLEAPSAMGDHFHFESAGLEGFRAKALEHLRQNLLDLCPQFVF